jgi:hypothetical protein
MAVSDWVPIASVAASATVALGVPFITARVDLRKIRAQANEARLDELRGVVDEAGEAMRATFLAFGDTVTEVTVRSAMIPSPLKREDTGKALQHRRAAQQQVADYAETVRVMLSWESRLVRVGLDDPLHAEYATAVELFNDALLPFTEVAKGTPFDQHKEQIREAQRKAAAAQHAFFNAAARRLGQPPSTNKPAVSVAR